MMERKHFHLHLGGLAMKSFRNFLRTSTTTRHIISVDFRRKNVKPESSVLAKIRFNGLLFQPENKELPDYLEDVQQNDENHLVKQHHI